ncbi:uncharacterized protein [Salminus brasiliensis]|uniref:uncharacterized protein isoform X2 n=1 Tax=Salminus brasiliensis TaxID=930266 RepID=UPI003B82FB11
MSLEPCPFCGKPFKRLRSHLPHCKMSPVSKTTKNNKAPPELPMTNPKDTTRKYQKNKANISDKKLNDPSFSKSQGKSSMKAGKVHVDEVTVAKVPSAERSDIDTVKPRSKWLAKREQEMVKQTTPQKELNNCLISQTSKDQVKGPPQIVKSVQGQNQKKPKGTTLTSLVTTAKFDISVPDILQVPWTSGSQAERSMPTHKGNANVFEETQHSPKALSIDLTLVSKIREQADFNFFQTKTCVWDHIKHGLYDRRLGSVLALHPTGPTREVCISTCGNGSVSVHKPHTVNNQTADTQTPSAALFALGQTSVRKSAEHFNATSTLQSKSAMEWPPEMAAGYDRTLVSSPLSGISSNEGLKTMHQSSRLPPQCPGPETVQRLGDVRLCELSAWLRTRTPKSPREAVTMLNRGLLLVHVLAVVLQEVH